MSVFFFFGINFILELNVAYNNNNTRKGFFDSAAGVTADYHVL